MGKGKAKYNNAPIDRYDHIDEQGVRLTKTTLKVLRLTNSQLLGKMKCFRHGGR